MLKYINSIKYNITKIFSSKPESQLTKAEIVKIKHQTDDGTLHHFKKVNRNFHFKNSLEFIHTYKEIFEEKIYNFKTENHNPIILDCGSNIGLAIIYFKSIFPGAIIHGFEPDSNNYNVLSTNIRENNLTDITLHQSAVWIHNNHLQFQSLGTHASRLSMHDDNANTVNVKCTRLKDFINQFNNIDFLKIDIEGAEDEVIKDIQEELKKVNNIFLEYHGKTNDTLKLINQLTILKDANFKVYIKNAADLLSSPFYNKSINDSPFEVQLNIFAYRE